MKIIYVHHGNRKMGEKPSQDDDLTEIGYKDCELVAELFNNEKIVKKVKAIYTSTFFRCIKTAEIVNKHLNVEIIKDESLNEFKSKDAEESWVDLQNRISNFIDKLKENFNDDDVVICVTSGVNVVGFLNKVYNLPANEKAPFIGVPNCCPLVFDV